MSEDAPTTPLAATDEQREGDRRKSLRGIWRASGVSGVLFGASGEERRQFQVVFAAQAVLVALSNTSNVLTILHDVPQWGVWPPIIWEGSSAVTLLLFLWIPWLAYRLAPPDSRPRWRLPAVHLPAMLAFSVAHVAGFVLLRQAIYIAAGSNYGYGPLTEDFLYEFRKDALSYLIIIALIWTVGLILRARVTGTKASARRAAGAFVDIRDGARLARVPLAQVLAVSAADNYVEFILDDDRHLMKRASLAAVERELAPKGFIRTHRSWLVNAARMTALEPEGSGDYAVKLGELSVPLSRRFPDALAKLRAG